MGLAKPERNGCGYPLAAGKLAEDPTFHQMRLTARNANESRHLVTVRTLLPAQFDLPLPKAWAFWCNFDVLSFLDCRCLHPLRFHPSFVQASATLMAPLPRVRQRAILSPLQRVLHLAFSIFCLPCQSQFSSPPGVSSCHPLSSGPSALPASRTVREPAAPPFGVCHARPIFSVPCVRCGSSV